MTNEQRDELLISLSKGLTNLQGSLNDLRTELTAKIEDVREELTLTRNELKEEILQVAKNNSEELKKEIIFNNVGIQDMAHDFYDRYKKLEHRVDQHDIEINNINTKLA